MRPRHWMALGALALILAITALWWALALWPLPATGPAWLLRTRAVCFGTTPSGLPDGYGWLTLIGEPILLLGMLLVLFGPELGEGLGALGASRAGRQVLRAGALGMVLAGGAAATRVARAVGGAVAPAVSLSAGDYPRLDRAAPALDLVDQEGKRLTLARFRGRPLFLTFAYAHCETVCPLVVRDALLARAQAGGVPAVVIVTLDPWRDTPTRLPAIAEQWRLPSDAWVASGDVAAVGRVLERWGVVRERDLRTGAVAHGTLVYVVDRGGRIAYAASGSAGADVLAELARRL